MATLKRSAWLAAAMGLATVGAAQAATITLTGDISTSTTLTANNHYNLNGQVRVLPGATITIEPGTVIATFTGANQGSLIITRGAKIYSLGTAEKPVIFTSAEDVATWTGSVVTRDGVAVAGYPLGRVNAITTVGNPKTGTWRAAATEWGSLAIMGKAFISNTKNGPVGNVATPAATNISKMEGLIGDAALDPNVAYGGGDDNDDSGTVTYTSLRYGGRVLALTDELNGMSLGGVGRETDIHHIEIQNNVDDGIEIFGGTVNLKYWSVWNIGDDSFDVDQGWRGKSQFGLIVQGYSLVAISGSGFPDNGFEMDGAEKADSQPVTAAVIYNTTFIGVPENLGVATADHAIALRDNANVQFRNCIFMDGGLQLVRNDNSDGEGSIGYGTLGTTLDFATRWNTPFNFLHTTGGVNLNTGTLTNATLPAFYPAQVDGNLIEVRDSVFFNNLDAAAYTESNTRGVTNAGGNSTALGVDNIVALAASSPIAGITRDTTINPNVPAPGNVIPGVKGTENRWVTRVLTLDPRARNDAVTSVRTAPADGFFTPVKYRGAFSPETNWMLGWTASDAFGFHAGQTNPAAPATTQQVLLSTTSFTTIIGLTYTVESSTDGITWTTDTSFKATTAGVVTVSSLVSVAPNKVYRVTVQ